MDDQAPIEVKARKRGQLPFALGFFLVAVMLALLIGDQTRWVEGTKLFAQPRFWPAVAIAIMVIFALFQVWHLPRHRFTADDWKETRIWLKPVEFAGWFMVYVWTVPIVGFLLSSVVFATALTYRIGYRNPRLLWAAALFAVAVVILFKGFLSVKIPGALIYDYLPGALRSFFILNL